MLLHPSISEISARRDRISQAVLKGHLTPELARYASPGWAYVLKETGVPALAYPRVGNYDGADDDTGSISYVVTTDDEDRDGDIVRPLGGHLIHYSQNPIVFFGHQERPIPIGVCRAPDGTITVYPEERRMVDKVYFDLEDPDADFIYQKCRRKILNATSIAFVPIEAWRRDDVRKAHTHSDQQGQPGWYFNQWDKTEVSIVGVPSNPKAVGLEKDLTGACRDVWDRERGDMSPRLRKAWQPYIAQTKGCWGGWCPLPGDEKDIGGGVVLKAVEKGSDGPAGGADVKVGDRVRHSQTGMMGGYEQGGKQMKSSGRTWPWFNQDETVKHARLKDLERIVKSGDGDPDDYHELADLKEQTGVAKDLLFPAVEKAKAIFEIIGGRKMAERLVQQLPSQGLRGTLPEESMSGPIGGWVHVEGDYDKIVAAARKLGSWLTDQQPYIERENGGVKTKAQPSDDIDPEKACQILRDGTIDGEPLTDAQRGMFGAACARAQKSWGGLRDTCKALVAKAATQADLDSPGVPGRNPNPSAALAAKAGAEEVKCPECGKPGKRYNPDRRGGFKQPLAWYKCPDGHKWSERNPNLKAALSQSDGRIGGYVVPPGGVQTNEEQEPLNDPIDDGWAACESCFGDGSCDVCGGSGTYNDEDCPECGGSGDCALCAGEGHVKKSLRKGNYAEDQQDLADWYAGKDTRLKPLIQQFATLPKSGNFRIMGHLVTRTNPGASVDGQGFASFQEAAAYILSLHPLKSKRKQLDQSNTSDANSGTPQPSVPQVLAALYSHAKAEAAYIDQLNDTYKGTLSGYRDDMDKRVERLKNMFADLSPEEDIEKLCKAFEDEHDKALTTDGPDSTIEPGEAGLVEQGQVPELDDGEEIIPGETSMPKSLKRRTMKQNTVPAEGAYTEDDPDAAAELNSGAAPFNKAAPGTEEWAEEELQEPEHKGGSEPVAEDAVLDDLGENEPIIEDKQSGKICMCGMEVPEGTEECPGCGAPVDKADVIPEEVPAGEGEALLDEGTSLLPEKDGDFNQSTDPAAEEILERYRVPKSNRWAVRKWKVAKHLLPFLKYRTAANGQKYLVRATQKGYLVVDPSHPLSGGKWAIIDSTTGKPIKTYSTEQAARVDYAALTRNKSVEEPTLDDSEVKALTTKLAGAIDDLKALVCAKDLPRQYKAGLKHVADQIWYVGKALTDKGKEQKNGGKGSELTDKGKEQRDGGKGSELKDKGEQQGKTPTKSHGGRHVGPAVEQKLQETMDKLKRFGVLNGSTSC